MVGEDLQRRKTVMMREIAFATTALLATTMSPLAHAGSWRCVDDPELPDCEEDLINDIEDEVIASWPMSFTVAVANLPYSCSKPPGHQRAPGIAEQQIQVTGSIPIYSTWIAALRAFLIGRYEVVNNLFGEVHLSGRGVTPAVWPGTGVDYIFVEAATDVMAPGGSTGVRDLGGVRHGTISGAYWGGALQVTMDWLVDGNWTCVVGPPGYRVTATGKNVVRFSYPIAWTHTDFFMAEAVRERFRRAVRLVVTGTP
jgi:hypothetical protein